ncbi:MAG: hypothetical protein ACI9VS_001811 [Candidatus Binatia bacterium]|jgi:hypothetical protein
MIVKSSGLIRIAGCVPMIFAIDLAVFKQLLETK